MKRSLPPLLAFALSAAALGAPGTWTQFASSGNGAVSAVALSSDGSSLWMTNTALVSPPDLSQVYVRVGSSSFASAYFDAFDNTGLDNAWHDNGHQGLVINKFGDPILRVQTKGLHNGTPYDRSPYFFYYDTALSAWAPSTFPPNEIATWNSAKEIVHDDNGDLLVCGNNNVLASTDGKNWTVRANLMDFVCAPPPYSPNYGANGKPAWVEANSGANTPLLNTSSMYWQFGIARMPWGELFIGGEAGCYVHSLDNGFTWEWFDDAMYRPQRDANGYPMYRNPACFALSQLYGAGATKDGEVMFNCDRNYGGGMLRNFFIWTAAGHVVEAQAGLNSWLSSSLHVGNFSRLVTLPSGDTFMTVAWLPIYVTTPTGNFADVFKWDGASWSIVTPPAPDWFVAGPNSMFTDGTSLYVGTASPDGIFKWTPDLSAGAPPVVTIAGGSSATSAPTTTLNAATGFASVQLSATATAENGHAMTYRWSARGPGPVAFEDAHALSPKAWFDTPGHYVLNLQATDAVLGLRAGASVIVHVNAASGGTAPTLTMQPQNFTFVSGQPVTFSVQANGSALRYQWRRNRDDIPGATSPTLTFTPSFADNGATYYCLVRNAWGKVVSNCGTLGAAPTITASPVNHTLSSGTSATMSVAALGTEPMRWQWKRNGAVIPGANLASYTTNIAGSYTCDVTNLFGTATSGAGVLSNGSASTYTMSITLGSSSGGTASGIHNVGAPVPIATEATAATGYYETFEKWTASGLPSGVTATFANPFSSQTTVTISGANAAGATIYIYANYKIATPYYLTVANGAGSIKSTQNAVVLITANAAPPGFVFDQWLGPGVANANAVQTTVTLTSPTQSVTATYIHPIEKWKTQTFGGNANNPQIAGPLADPDGDGFVNTIEYALGSDALVPSATVPIVGTVDISGLTYLTLTFTRTATDADYTVEVSSDLTQAWTAGSRYTPLGNALATAATTDITPQGSPAGYTVVRDNTPTSIASHRFIHLKIATP